jgi:hypothetical protein
VRPTPRGALAAGAVVLFVTAPRGVGLTVAPQPGGASLGARGVF